MVTRTQIDQFYAQNPIAVVGVSRNHQKFGNVVFTELIKKGKTVYPVNPKADKIGETVCFPDIASLPSDVAAVVLLTRKEKTAEMVKAAMDKGLKHIWIQQGSHTPAALEAGKAGEVNLIYGKCIMMFAEPVEGFHKFHRNLVKFFGRLPK